MMQLLALIHSDVGPIISIRRVRRPALKVTNLPHGASLQVSVTKDSGARVLSWITANGVHPIEAGAWLQIMCEGAKRHKTICCVVNKAA